MAYVITENRLGQSQIGSVDTSAAVPVGTIVTATDPSYGSGEFIYLAGVASTVAGSWVLYDLDDGSTSLLTAGDKGLVAVATAATVADTYGWYQIMGNAVGSAGTGVDSGRVFIDTVPGTCDDAVVIGDQVLNARWVSADDSDAGTADVSINRPFTIEPST